METLPAVRESQPPALRSELTIDDLTKQVGTIQQAMEAVMKDGEHYGVIPGTHKPSLLKPGAEKLCLLFRLAPKIRTEKTWHPDGHLDVSAYVTLIHVPSGMKWAEDIEAFCSTRESRYRYRNAKKVCPKCGNGGALVRSEKKSAYFCISNKGGCGARFAFGSKEANGIDSQAGGKVENPDLADVYNTIVKMACKRALVAAVLVTTAASDIFAQDIEDFAEQFADEAAREQVRPVRERKAEPKADAEAEPAITAEQRRELVKLAKDAGLTQDEFKQVVEAVSGQTSAAKLTEAQYDLIVADLAADGDDDDDGQTSFADAGDDE